MSAVGYQILWFLHKTQKVSFLSNKFVYFNSQSGINLNSRSLSDGVPKVYSEHNRLYTWYVILLYSKSHSDRWKRINIRCRDGEWRGHVEKPENVSPVGTKYRRLVVQEDPTSPQRWGQRDVPSLRGNRDWSKDW